MCLYSSLIFAGVRPWASLIPRWLTGSLPGPKASADPFLRVIVGLWHQNTPFYMLLEIAGTLDSLSTERNVQFATPPTITFSHWLFFLDYIPLLKLRLVLKLSNVMRRPVR